MFKSPNLYSAVFFLALSGAAGYWWWVAYSGGGESDTAIRIEVEDAPTPEVVVEVFEPSLEAVNSLAKADVALLHDATVVEGALVADEVLVLPDRFPNESLVRGVLDQLKGEVTGNTLSAAAYQAYLLDLEELLVDAAPQYAEVWSLIQSELGHDFLKGLENSVKGEKVLAAVERKFGFVWGQADPEQSLHFARQAGPDVLAGWLTGQIIAKNDPTALLEDQNLVPSPEVYWEALLDVAKTDTILSLNSILENHMDEMTLGKWKEILFSKGNSDEPVLAEWFQENIGSLSSYPDFDEIEVIRMLRRYDYGEGPFMLTADVERVDAAKATKNYTEVARVFEELSAEYDGVIDASAAGRFALDWSKQDFAAASDWLLANSEKISDLESMESMLGTMYRHKAGKEPGVALSNALQIEDETLQALALSNTVIPQLEKIGTEAPVEWVSQLPQGFAKQRSMAGYVLGLSRHAEETTLEAQVKFQFLQDEFDLAAIQDSVMNSELNSQDKISVVELFNTY